MTPVQKTAKAKEAGNKGFAFVYLNGHEIFSYVVLHYDKFSAHDELEANTFVMDEINSKGLQYVGSYDWKGKWDDKEVDIRQPKYNICVA